MLSILLGIISLLGGFGQSSTIHANSQGSQKPVCPVQGGPCSPDGGTGGTGGTGGGGTGGR
jgi:hypothetical protein